MSTWIYKQTEPRLWTVGTMWRTQDGVDRLDPESDHGTPEEAAARVRFLNGGGPVGICGARCHTTSSYDGAHVLWVCAKTPAHVENGDADHQDTVVASNPTTATWRDSEPELGPGATCVNCGKPANERDDHVIDGELYHEDCYPDEGDLAHDPDAMESMYPRDREDGEGLGLHRPSYGD